MFLRILAVLALVAGVAAMNVRPAAACSCYIGDPRERLAEADAAFVGRLLGRFESDVTEPRFNSMSLASYVFEVETAVKGDLGKTVEVFSSWDGASCGFEGGVIDGERVGVWLYEGDDGNYRGGLCTTMDADVLLSVANPLPPPDGSRPIEFIIGGEFGDARLMALDGGGRTIAYGRGEGPTGGVALCPGGERTVEIYGPPDDVKTGVRDLATFEMVAERSLVGESAPSGLPGFDKLTSLGMTSDKVRAVSCLDATGMDAAFVANTDREGWRGVLARVQVDSPDSYVDVLWTGAFRHAQFSPTDDVVFLIRRTSEGAGTLNTFTAFGLDTGEMTDLASVPLMPSDDRILEFEVNPDGDLMAAIFAQSGGPSKRILAIVDISGESPELHQVQFDESELGSELIWTDDDQLVMLPNRQDSPPKLFSQSLELLEEPEGPITTLEDASLRDGWLHGLTWANNSARIFLSVDTGTGQTVEHRKFHYNDVKTLLTMPGERTIRPFSAVETTEPPVIDNGGTSEQVAGSSADSGQPPGGAGGHEFSSTHGEPGWIGGQTLVFWAAIALGTLFMAASGYLAFRRFRPSRSH